MTGPKATSPWLDGEAGPGYPPLDGDARAEVAVVGAGITGLTAALLLAEAGRDVLVVEMDRVGRGATGYTTAKVSSQHGVVYHSLASAHGDAKARAYGQANQAGLELIAGWVKERGIECGFRRRAAYAYALSESQRSQLQREAETAERLGLPASFVDELPLPFTTSGAVRFDDQAEFDAYAYVAGLAGRFTAAGGRIVEDTRAVGLSEGEPNEVRTDRGAVHADHVIVASHPPYLDRTLAFARAAPQRSYSIAVTLDGEPPEGMFISSEGPTRSLRAAGELLLVGGEGHKVGQGGDTEPRYERLEAFAREHFQVRSVDYRWSTQDLQSADGMPLVGPLTPLSKRAWMATGFNKWGMTNGTAAAMILSEAVLGKESAWAEAFDSNRLRPRASLPSLVKENANVGWHFFADRLRQLRPRRAEELQPGEAAIARLDGQAVAAYRSEAGELLAVSPNCTHLWCTLAWNAAERSWDCPCHGSRFAPDGSVLQGPAVSDLERKL